MLPAVARLKRLAQRGENMLQGAFVDGQQDVWCEQCVEAIQAVFGRDTGHVSHFYGPVNIGRIETLETVTSDIARRCGILAMLIEELEAEGGPATSNSSGNSEGLFWGDMHPEVKTVAQSRYDSGHYADAVEAALKALERKVRAIHTDFGKTDAIGAALMRAALTPHGGSVMLEDLATTDGKNIQQGYMEMMAGAMTGIRNPKAHGNISIDARRARHHLYMASLFFSVVDERLVDR